MLNDKLIADWIQEGSLVSIDRDTLLMGWGKRRWIASPPEDHEKPSFYFPDFFLKNSTPWFIHENSCIVSKQELLNLLPPSDYSEKYVWKNELQPLFKQTFLSLIQAFSKGEMHKAVPFVFDRCTTSFSKQQLQKSLINALNFSSMINTFLYGFWGDNHGILGATPETLFRMQDSHMLQTMACAGTCKVEDAERLLISPKEMEEHIYVVEGIKSDLNSLGEIRLGKTEVIKLSKLAHLLTPISVKLNRPFSFLEVVSALHPTPALGVFPRNIGWSWLESYQKKIDRQRFGAPAGCIFNNTGVCYVSIRNVQWDKDGMSIGAGCGVTLNSQYEKEWEEVQLKLRVIKEILAL